MDAFAALADPVRRNLLIAVSGGPLRVVDLAADQAVTRPAVSRHLRLLTDAGLLTAEDRGRERHYRLQPRGLDEVRGLLDRLQGNASQPVGRQRGAGGRGGQQATPLSPGVLSALETEVRRTTRAGRAAAAATARKDTA